MEWMAGARTHSWRLIDEHGVDGFDIISTEALEVGHKVGVSAVGLQLLIVLEVLDLGDVGLPVQVR